MMKRIVKLLFGLALIPFCLGLTWQFGAMIFAIAYAGDAPYYFVAGAFSYLTMHLLFKKPIFAYVIGHELTHALFAVLFGGSVKSLQASDRGGRVRVTKSNFVITLAPYFFPVYTFLALLLYGSARAAGAAPPAVNIIIFLTGASFTFHLVLTAVFLGTDQKDIAEHGAFFSYPLIYLFNLGFAAFLVYVFLARNMNYLKFLSDGIIRSANFILFLAHKILSLIPLWQQTGNG